MRRGLKKVTSLSSVASQEPEDEEGAGGRVIKSFVAFARASLAGPAWGTGTPKSSERVVQSAEATRDSTKE
jgi:hypothetical protein